MFPAPAALTRHRPPALLIAEVLESAAAGGRVRLLPGSADDPLTLLEAAAQAAAVIAGAAGHAAGAVPRPGALVAARAFCVVRSAVRDEQLEVAIHWGAALGALRQAEATIHAASGEEVARGALTVAEGVEITSPVGAGAGDGGAAASQVTSGGARGPGAPGVDFAPQRHAAAALLGWQVQPAAAVTAELRFPADLPLFAGHFPGRPLVPGVHLLAGALAAVQRVVGDGWTMGEVVRAKWSGAVRPGDEARIAARWQERGAGLVVDASLTVADAVCMTCRMTLRSS